MFKLIKLLSDHIKMVGCSLRIMVIFVSVVTHFERVLFELVLLIKEQRVFHEVDERSVNVTCLSKRKVQVKLLLVGKAPDKDVVEIPIYVRIVGRIISKH